MQHLEKGKFLQGGKYRIERMLGQGGFGITYLAEQTMLERKVCIKEFFFKDYCERDDSTSNVTLSTKSNRELVERFKKKFLKEARVISRLQHDNIVHIHDIFEENSTAYYVMDYIEGESLGDMVKHKGNLKEQEALVYIKEVGKALTYIHSKNINHLDIKPNNIMLRREDRRILIIDFGVSKQYDEETAEGTTTTPVGISHGYSPAEQYRKNGVQSFSPQSDVYALAATLYKLLTGTTPPEAIEVQDEGLPTAPLQEKGISETTITAIINALKSRSRRTQSITAFISEIYEPEEVTVLSGEKPKQQKAAEQKPKHEQETKQVYPQPVMPQKRNSQQPKTREKKNGTKSESKIYIRIIVSAAILLVVIWGAMYLNMPNQESDSVKVNTLAETDTINGHGYVDLGLSVKWATCNVGASSPEDYGGYYAWGETTTKSRYDWENCFDYLYNTGDSLGIYKKDGKTSITPASGHDTARENWGGSWRMPKITEIEELNNKCKWTWTTKNGKKGYVVTGPNGNSIFLPAAGWRYGTNSYGVDTNGYYWSSTLSSGDSYYACSLYFNGGYHSTYNNGRSYGQSVRPVTE